MNSTWSHSSATKTSRREVSPARRSGTLVVTGDSHPEDGPLARRTKSRRPRRLRERPRRTSASHRDCWWVQQHPATPDHSEDAAPTCSPAPVCDPPPRNHAWIKRNAALARSIRISQTGIRLGGQTSMTGGNSGSDDGGPISTAGFQAFTIESSRPRSDSSRSMIQRLVRKSFSVSSSSRRHHTDS
jgi:hypothetical protein